jgi:hypothetical protein
LNTQTGTIYALVLTDAFKLVTLSNASAITVTVPTNASVAFAVDTVIDFMQLGAGLVTFAPAGGVTINSKNGVLSMNGQWSGCSLIQTATNVWELIGVAGPVGLPSRQSQVTTATTTTSTTWIALLSTGAWTTNSATNYLLLHLTACANCSSSGGVISFQITLDGTDIGVTQTYVVTTGDPTSCAIAVRIACSGNASHTVVVNWRTSTGTATIDPTQTHSSGLLLMHGNLVVQEVSS